MENGQHGRYQDIFNLNAIERQQRGEKNKTRPMRMSPDIDFKVDRHDRKDDTF